MPKQTYAKKSLPLMTILIYISLIAGAGTYFLPVIRVNLPPLGEKSWSVQDVVGPVVQRITLSQNKGEAKTASIKLDHDFFKVVSDVSPKNPQTSAPRKISPTYILGALVPVALLASYLFLIVGLFLAALKTAFPFVVSSAIAAGTAIYALLGTFYLGSAAERAFSNAVSRASEGVLGVITKNFVVQLTVQPSVGLFLLAILMSLAFVAALYRSNQRAFS